ncbi:MAG TPA: hypothetical protein VMT09_14900 [Steroidobacteraceae bacterium]|nr:hypothetical protein [Steroidobacteraceae bacterium]
MATNEPKVFDVLVGVYKNADEAKSDYTALRNLYQKLGASDDFDAAVVSKSPEGKVRIDKAYEAGTVHDALKGLGFGLAAGIIATAFPGVGIAIALLAGGVGGTAIGAIVGHVQTGMRREDLKKIGDALDDAESGLVVVYEANLADQVKKNVKAVRQVISKLADIGAEDIEKQIRQWRAAA